MTMAGREDGNELSQHASELVALKVKIDFKRQEKEVTFPCERF